MALTDLRDDLVAHEAHTMAADVIHFPQHGFRDVGVDVSHEFCAREEACAVIGIVDVVGMCGQLSSEQQVAMRSVAVSRYPRRYIRVCRSGDVGGKC